VERKWGRGPLSVPIAQIQTQLESFWSALPAVFGWLNSRRPVEDLAPVQIAAGSEVLGPRFGGLGSRARAVSPVMLVTYLENRIGKLTSAVNMQRSLWPHRGTTVSEWLAPNFSRTYLK